jgi:zinc protease
MMQKSGRIIFLAGLLLALQSLVAQPLLGKRVSHYRLKNGLRLYVVVDHRAPVALSTLWYHVGGVDEHAGITGLAHLVEHMMFKARVPGSKQSFSQVFAQQGADQNAFTSQDTTVYYEQVPRQELPKMLHYEALRMQPLAFQAAAFLAERKVVLEERAERVDDQPLALASERHQFLVAMGNPYHNPVVGWRKDIEQLTAKDVALWHRHWYRPDQATLVVVGDVVPRQVFHWVKQSFGRIRNVGLLGRRPFAAMRPLSQRRLILHLPRVVMPVLLMSYNVPRYQAGKKGRDAFALELMSGVFNAQVATRLVERDHVAASFAASYAMLSRYDGAFSIIASPFPGVSVQQLEARIRKELDELQHKRLPASVLAQEWVRQKADFVFDFDAMMTWPMMVGTVVQSGVPVRFIDTYLHHLKRVKADDVVRVARHYFVAPNETVTWVLPEVRKSSKGVGGRLGAKPLSGNKGAKK